MKQLEPQKDDIPDECLQLIQSYLDKTENNNVLSANETEVDSVIETGKINQLLKLKPTEKEEDPTEYKMLQVRQK